MHPDDEVPQCENQIDLFEALDEVQDEQDEDGSDV